MDTYNVKGNKMSGSFFSGDSPEDYQKALRSYRSARNSYNSYDGEEFVSSTISSSLLVGILKYFLFAILLSVILKFLQGNSTVPTFTSLLSTLQDIPDISIPFLNFQPTVLGDWGILNALRDFFASLISLIDVVIFFFNGIINVVFYVSFLFKWLFYRGLKGATLVAPIPPKDVVPFILIRYHVL